MRRLVLALALLFGVAAGFFVGSARAAPACTLTIAPGTSSLSGSLLHPGDVVCLPAGNRGKLTVTNAHGTAAQPITITNSGGVVHLTGDDYAGIWLQSSDYVRVLGNGLDERCGAPVAENDQHCGIVIQSQTTGRGVSATKKSTHVEVAYVEVFGGGEAGINIKDDSQANTSPQWILDGVNVHHTWVHDIQAGSRHGAEAMYLGSSYYIRGDPPTRHIEVAFNRTARIGWESYQVSGADLDCRIHDNVSSFDSQALESGQVGSIKAKEGSVCDITDNVMSDGGSRGITDYGHGGNVIARNTIIRAGRLESVGANSGSGIVVLDGDVSNRTLHIDNNTIDSPKGHGIYVSPTLSNQSTIQNNRICGQGGLVVKNGANATISGNGCTPQTPTPSATPTSTLTASPSPSPTQTFTPTPLPTSTSTPVPTDTLIPTPSPTETPVCGAPA